MTAIDQSPIKWGLHRSLTTVSDLVDQLPRNPMHLDGDHAMNAGTGNGSSSDNQAERTERSSAVLVANVTQHCQHSRLAFEVSRTSSVLSMKGTPLTETTETPEKYDFSTDPHDVTRDDVLGSDFYLDALLRMTFGDRNNNSNSIGMTFMIDGTIVSGIAISGTEWARRMAERLLPASSSMSEGFSELTKDMEKRSTALMDTRIAEERPLPAFRFVHLRDVRVSTGVMTQEIPLWRGQIAKMSGWTIGSSNTPEEARGE